MMIKQPVAERPLTADASDADAVAKAAASPEAVLRLRDVRKEFRRRDGTVFTAVDDISLNVAKGEMIVILGPSGCGKTTLLRCIAGLERPTSGEIAAETGVLSSGLKGIVVAPERRNFGMMFQSYALWPHMSVRQNVGYPLKVRRKSRKEIGDRVDHILELVGIRHLRDEYPAQLSGGQQQRVALARSLVADPAVVLFDEPLSNVDAKVREDLRVELAEMQSRVGFAGLYVTHDQEEAMALGHRILVMDSGQEAQLAPPREVYKHPATRFVAKFVGSANEWPGRIERIDDGSDAGTTLLSTECGELEISSSNLPADRRPGQDVVVVVRPETITIGTLPPEQHTTALPGRVASITYTGPNAEVRVECDNQHVLRVRTSPDVGVEVGAAVFLTISAEDVRVFALDREKRIQEPSDA